MNSLKLNWILGTQAIVIILLGAMLVRSCSTEKIAEAPREKEFLSNEQIPFFPKGNLTEANKLIDAGSAKDYTENYKDFIGNTARLFNPDLKLSQIMFRNWCPACSSEYQGIMQYRIHKETLKDLLAQDSADYIMVFPAIRGNQHTLVIAAAKTVADSENPGKFTVEVIKKRSKPRYGSSSVIEEVIYDEIGSCPPPNGCRGFN